MGAFLFSNHVLMTSGCCLTGTFFDKNTGEDNFYGNIGMRNPLPAVNPKITLI